MKLLSCLSLENEVSHGLSECIDLWDAKKGFDPPIEENILCMEKHHQCMELFRIELPCFPRKFPDCNAYSCFMASEEAAYDEKSELHSPHTRTWKVPVSSPWDSVRLALEGLSGARHGRIPHEHFLQMI
ncbi:hypothetical protein HAX54_031360 [Datura stramonium]|uniref:Uncharacterized protein n=1 Tax=Datura stramonium TaxID=4076 RepID=A0ABS8VBY5_DATST|nr:hypothetical protein [Datura stramonium]